VCKMLSKALDGTLMSEEADIRMLSGVNGDGDEDEDDDGGSRKKLRFEDLSQEEIESLGMEPDVLKRLMDSWEGMKVDEDGDEESKDEDDYGEEFCEEVMSLKDPEALDSLGP